MSYENFLRELVQWMNNHYKLFSPLAAAVGVGFDAVSAQDAWDSMPWISGHESRSAPGKGMNRDAIPQRRKAEKYFFHFPDGNASIARLLVRKLIRRRSPEIPATDVVTARANYAKLDHELSPVAYPSEQHSGRVRHQGPSQRQRVEIG